MHVPIPCHGGASHSRLLNSLSQLVLGLSVEYETITSTPYIATVCRQVCCMYWGHLGHFHRAISHLTWYKIVCMRYLACTFNQMKSINMLSSLFSCLCMTMLTSNSSGNIQKHGYLGCFHAASARENISWVWVIDLIDKSHNAPVPYSTILHSEQKCAHFCSERSIVGYATGAFLDLHISVLNGALWNILWKLS